MARFTAATARWRNAANVSAPVRRDHSPLDPVGEPAAHRLAFLHAERHLAQARRSATGSSSASPTISAVTRARDSGEETIVADAAIAQLLRRRARLRHARSRSAEYRHCPARCPGRSSRSRHAGETRTEPARACPPGTPRAPQARPSCCSTRCTAGRASMRSRCASQFGGSFMFMRFAPQNST